MRGVAAVFLCAATLLASGCSFFLEERLISTGIGTELPAEDIAETNRKLEAYLSYLCEQVTASKIETRGDPSNFVCNVQPFAAGWTLLVKAGFNDIDRRCDGYLAWLSSRRRNRSAILSQITDMRTFTEALLFATGVSATPLAIVGMAFGLASSTFTNYYTRLIFEIEKSTVEVVVREKRLQFRERINTVLINNQPDAVFALREYLLICTPYYIESVINQRTRDSISNNRPGDEAHPEQVRAAMVSEALLRSIPSSPRDPIVVQPRIEPLMEDGRNAVEQAITRSTGQSIQSNLCVAPLTPRFDPATREAIRQAKVGGNQSGPNARPFNNTRDGIESRSETQIFLGSRPCSSDMSGIDRGYRTAFEKFAFANEAAVKDLQNRLALCNPNLNATGRFDDSTRAAIKNARKGAGLDPAIDTLNDQSYNTISRTCR